MTQTAPERRRAERIGYVVSRTVAVIAVAPTVGFGSIARLVGLCALAAAS